MRLKQRGALLLASVMLVGSVGMMNPIEVRAAGSTFTLTVPADTSITGAGWNQLKNGIKVTGTLAEGESVKVTITGATSTETKGFLVKNDASSVPVQDDEKVSYELKLGNAEASSTPITTDGIVFSKTEIDGGTAKQIGAIVESFDKKDVGNYTGKIEFEENYQQEWNTN